MPNNLAAFQAEKWSTRLIERIDQINVMMNLVNRNWEGDLTKSKSVWIRAVGDITMAPYTRGTNINYEDLNPTKESFDVNDGQYFAFNVDDIDKAQSDLSAMDLYMNRAVISMNNKVEEKLAHAFVKYCLPSNFLGNAGNTGAGATGTATVNGSGVVTAINITAGGANYQTGKVGVVLMGPGSGVTGTVTVTGGAVTAVTITAGGSGYKNAPLVTFVAATPVTYDSTTGAQGIYKAFLDARAKLHNNNVYGQQWAIVSPDVSTLIMNDIDHFTRVGNLADSVMQLALVDNTVRQTPANRAAGLIGVLCGFLVYETPHVPRDITGGSYIIWGDNDVVSYAAQITEIEVLRLQNTFADACRGLLLHDTYVPGESKKRLVIARSQAA